MRAYRRMQNFFKLLALPVIFPSALVAESEDNGGGDDLVAWAQEMSLVEIEEQNVQSQVMRQSHEVARKTRELDGGSYYGEDGSFRFGREFGEGTRDSWNKLNSAAKKLKAVGAGASLIGAVGDGDELAEVMISGHKQNGVGGLAVNVGAFFSESLARGAASTAVVTEFAVVGTSTAGYPYGTAAGAVVGLGSAVLGDRMLEDMFDYVGGIGVVKTAQEYWGKKLNEFAFGGEESRGALNHEYLEEQQERVERENAEESKSKTPETDDEKIERIGELAKTLFSNSWHNYQQMKDAIETGRMRIEDPEEALAMARLSATEEAKREFERTLAEIELLQKELSHLSKSEISSRIKAIRAKKK